METKNRGELGNEGTRETEKRQNFPLISSTLPPQPFPLNPFPSTLTPIPYSPYS